MTVAYKHPTDPDVLFLWTDEVPGGVSSSEDGDSVEPAFLRLVNPMGFGGKTFQELREAAVPGDDLNPAIL